MKLTRETIRCEISAFSSKRAMRIAMAGLIMMFLLTTLALAATPRCFVKLYGQWYEWQGSCSDWSAYFNAGYGGIGGGCTYLMPAGGVTHAPPPGGNVVPRNVVPSSQ